MPADQRRQQLFEVARERFAHQGFHATSMDEIAEAAGVTKPVLYQHFPSKRALYVDILEETGRQLLVDTDDPVLREEFAAAADEERRALVTMLNSSGVPHVALSTEGDWLQPLSMFLGRTDRR